MDTEIVKIIFIIGFFITTLAAGAAGLHDALEMKRCRYTSLAKLYPVYAITCEVFLNRWND